MVSFDLFSGEDPWVPGVSTPDEGQYSGLFQTIQRYMAPPPPEEADPFTGSQYQGTPTLPAQPPAEVYTAPVNTAPQYGGSYDSPASPYGATGIPAGYFPQNLPVQGPVNLPELGPEAPPPNNPFAAFTGGGDPWGPLNDAFIPTRSGWGADFKTLPEAYNTEIPIVSPFMREAVRPAVGDVADFAMAPFDTLAGPVRRGLGIDDAVPTYGDIARMVGEASTPVTLGDFALTATPGIGDARGVASALGKIGTGEAARVLAGSPLEAGIKGLPALARAGLPESAGLTAARYGAGVPVGPDDLARQIDEAASASAKKMPLVPVEKGEYGNGLVKYHSWGDGTPQQPDLHIVPSGTKWAVTKTDPGRAEEYIVDGLTLPEARRSLTNLRTPAPQPIPEQQAGAAARSATGDLPGPTPAAPTGAAPASQPAQGAPPPGIPPTGAGGGGEPSDPVAKLRDLVEQARPMPAETEALRAQRRRQQVAIGASQLERGGRTPEAFEKARGALAGEMPRTGFESPDVSFAPEEAQQLRDMIGKSDLRFYEEVNTEAALQKVMDGRLNEIRDFELSLLDRVYGPELSFSLAQKIAPPSFRDKVYEYWISNILSGWLTQARNIVGNTSTAMVAPVDRLGSAVVDVARTAITGAPRERFFAEAPAIVHGMALGLPDATRAMLKVFKEGFNPVKAGRVEFRKAAIGGLGGRITRMPLTALEAFDALFKGVNSEGAYRALAVREAKKAGLQGDEYTERVAELLAHRPDDLLEAAGKQSEAWLFRDDPTRIGEAVMKAREVFPPLGFIMPFARTPDRLVAYGLRHSPAGLFDVPMWKRLAQGNPEAVDELAQTLIGSTVAAGMATAVATGMMDITAGVPFNAAERDRFFREGKQPFSVKIGGQWIQYNQIPVLAETLTMVAAATEAYREGGDITDIVARTGATVAQSVADRSYMSGLSDLMDAVVDPARNAERYLTRLAGGFIPGSGFQGQTARAIDPTIRDPEGPIESLKTGIPGLSQTVPPRLTVFGEEAQRAFPSPVTVSTAKQSPVDAELERLGMEVGFVGDSIAGMPLGRDLQADYQRAAGQNTKALLTALVSSNAWKQLGDGDKTKLIEKAVTASRDRVRDPINETVGQLLGSDAFKALKPEQQEEIRSSQALQDLVRSLLRSAVEAVAGE